MVYAIILVTDFGLEIRVDIPGVTSLEKYTNDRISNMYPKGKKVPITVGDISVMATVKYVYKVYPHSRCEELAS